MTQSDATRLDAQLQQLHLRYIQKHYQAFATKAAEQQRSHVDYLAPLIEGEATMRENRSIERRITNARFPVLKTLDTFALDVEQRLRNLLVGSHLKQVATNRIDW